MSDDKPKNKGGRPKLPPAPTDEQVATIVELVAAGNYLQTAVAYLGIELKTVDNWLKLAAKEQARASNTRLRPRKSYVPFVEFKRALSRAMNASEVDSVNRIQALVTDSEVLHSLRFKAETFLLERRHPERWAKRAVDINGVSLETQAETSTLRGDELRDRAIGALDTPARSSMTREEAVTILTSIARGEAKRTQTTARGEMFLQGPNFKDRHDAAVTLLKELDKGKTEESSVKVAVYRRDDELH